MEDTIKKLFEVNSKELPSSVPIFPLDMFYFTIWKITSEYI